MRVYSLYTTSHRKLVDDWFLATLPHEMELILEFHHQECPSGNFETEGWLKTMLHKVDLILRGIEENWNGTFIHADVDIQFFGTCVPQAEQALAQYDIVYQRNCPKGYPCAGFFACRGNEQTRNLWQTVKAICSAEHINDQRALHRLIRSKYPIRWGLLPDTFFGGGMFTGKLWNVKADLFVPDDILMHHANWVIGVDEKIAQLQKVRDIVEARQHANLHCGRSL